MMKKLFALLLAAVMLLGAGATALAAGADYTLTENDLNNLTSLTEGVRFALVNGQIVTAE